MYQVSIDGANVDGMTVPGTTSLNSDMGARATGGITLHCTSSYRPCKGDEVFFYDTERSANAFGGVVSSAKRRIIPGSDIHEWTLKFTDFSALADRARVFKSYASTTMGGIVRDVITTKLAQFGVTAGVIEEGQTVSKAKYNGQSCTEIFNKLADDAGFIWFIDDAKKLHFLSKESYTAPFSITDDNPDYSDLSVEDTLEGFCNAVYFRGPANGITDQQTESFIGDGVRTEFAVRYKVHSVPTITLNGVAQTVGISVVDSGKQWYWNEGEKAIKQDAGGTVLTASDTLVVTYVGTFSVMVLLEDKASIAAHGRYETLVEDTSVPYLDAAIVAAQTKLRQNDYDKVNVNIVTRAPGLRAGMVIHVQQSDHDNLDTDVLITSVEANELADVDLSLEYTVEGVSGERREDWVSFYRMLTSRTSYEERPDETINECGMVEATCNLSMTASVISRPQWIWGTSVWGGGDAFW